MIRPRGCKSTITVSEYADIIGPSAKMLGPIKNGGRIKAITAPGCWGPMLTPEITAGHEVTLPIAVDGAQIGDAVAIRIEKIDIQSLASTSGIHRSAGTNFVSDPMIDAKCPSCKIVNPASVLSGWGSTAVRCAHCGEAISPFEMEFGYTMVFDDSKSIGLTVPLEVAEQIAADPMTYAVLPGESKQHPACILGRADLPPTPARVSKFIGNIGTVPGVDIPCNKNAGDSALSLVDAQNRFAISLEKIGALTDGHMDNNKIGEGSIIIAPVRVEGAGIYVGDVHAMQGEGEVAGHTTDVSACVVLKVDLIKDLGIGGPIILPGYDGLKPLMRPFTEKEISASERLADKYGFTFDPRSAPLYFIGTGENLNSATETALLRISAATGITIEEVKTRVTINGTVEICRLPGVVQVGALLPMRIIEKMGMGAYIKTQYQI